MKKIGDILEGFKELFQETEIKSKTLIELMKEMKKQDREKNRSTNRYEKDFSANKKFMKNINDETRSQVSFKISEKKEFTSLFDDSKSLQIENFQDKKETRFKKKDLDNLSPKSIKSQLSGMLNFQHHLDDNMSQLTYGVIHEETDIYNSSQESEEGSEEEDSKPGHEDAEGMAKAESIRAQKDFGLMAKKLQHKFNEMSLQVRVKRRQLGVLCDRLGRLLIDLAPHFMVDTLLEDSEDGQSSKQFSGLI